MEKTIVVLNKIIGKGTNVKLRDQALRIANKFKAEKDFNELVDIEKVVEVEEVIDLSVPDFLLKIQDKRRKQRNDKH